MKFIERATIENLQKVKTSTTRVYITYTNTNVLLRCSNGQDQLSSVDEAVKAEVNGEKVYCISRLVYRKLLPNVTLKTKKLSKSVYFKNFLQLQVSLSKIMNIKLPVTCRIWKNDYLGLL